GSRGVVAGSVGAGVGVVRRREVGDSGLGSHAAAVAMRPGQPEGRTYDYVRHGTTPLFGALEVKTGKIIGQCHQRHRGSSFGNSSTALMPRSRAAWIFSSFATTTPPSRRR